MKKKVLVTYNMLRGGYAELIEKFDVTFPPEGVEAFTYDEILAMIDEYEVLQPMFNFKVDEAIITKGKKLELISNYAVGFDNIDVECATRCGVQVTNTPHSVTEPTADHAMGLIYAVSRRISEMDRRIRIKGDVHIGLLENLGHSLYGKTLGIVGMGRIGCALARRAMAAGMKIVYTKRNRMSDEEEKRYEATYMTLDKLLKCADIVSLNAPYTPETYHIIGERELDLMKEAAILINTARGPLVDEQALIKALKEGKIWGAGLDVYEEGDFPSDELTKLNNAVVTPHLGTQTVETRNEMAYVVSQNIINFYEGGEVFKVNSLQD